MSNIDKETNPRCDGNERFEDPLKSTESGCFRDEKTALSLLCGDANNEKDNVASTSSTKRLSKTETDTPKVDIEDELDKFYKELEQIEPTDVNEDGSSNVDTCVPSDGQQQRVASNLDDQPQSVQQNKSQISVQTPHFQYTDHPWPPHKCSDSILPSSPIHEEPLRNVQWPHQNMPPPCRSTLFSRPRYNLRGPNQDFSWSGNGPVSSFHKYGDWDSDPYQGHSLFVPNGFHSFRMNAPVCFDTYGQVSSSCWSYSEEKQFQQPPCVTHSDPLSLIIMRGAPGSGKSTMARELLSSSPNGLILSTDDYFLQEGSYIYDPRLLSDAHCWNQSRTMEALCEYQSPIIIDNTNMQAWEMKPYVEMALEKGYSVCFQEPNTAWRYEPSELERRNKHGVPKEKIAKMMERFELPMTVDIVLRSQAPSHRRPDHVFKGQRKRRMDMDDFQ